MSAAIDAALHIFRPAARSQGCWIRVPRPSRLPCMRFLGAAVAVVIRVVHSGVEYFLSTQSAWELACQSQIGAEEGRLWATGQGPSIRHPPHCWSRGSLSPVMIGTESSWSSVRQASEHPHHVSFPVTSPLRFQTIVRPGAKSGPAWCDAAGSETPH